MKIWQGCLIAFVGFAALIGVVVAVAFYATSGITDTADEFFAAANEDEFAEARGLTSQQLQNNLSVEDLQVFMVEYSLDKVTETSWSSRSINNDRGDLTGTVTTETGGTVPVEVQLIWENDEWRINFIDVDSAGVQSSEDGQAASPVASMIVPSAEDQQDLIWATTTGFYHALDKPDFSDFRTRFVDEITAEILEENFASFRDLRPQMRMLPVAEPTFEPVTALNDSGHLELTGTYDLGDSEFRFKYIFSGEGAGPRELVFMDVELI